VFTGASSLLRRLTAASSVILLLGLALLALAAAAVAGPAPDPSPSLVSPDPYRTAPAPPGPPAAIDVAVPPRQSPVRRGPTAKHIAKVHETARAVPRARRPDFPVPSIGERLVGVPAADTRISKGLAIAVAALVLISGALVAGVAREVAR
jgi:hypothetical protein